MAVDGTCGRCVLRAFSVIDEMPSDSVSKNISSLYHNVEATGAITGDIGVTCF